MVQILPTCTPICLKSTVLTSKFVKVLARFLPASRPLLAQKVSIVTHTIVGVAIKAQQVFPPKRKNQDFNIVLVFFENVSFPPTSWYLNRTKTTETWQNYLSNTFLAWYKSKTISGTGTGFFNILPILELTLPASISTDQYRLNKKCEVEGLK